MFWVSRLRNKSFFNENKKKLHGLWKACPLLTKVFKELIVVFFNVFLKCLYFYIIFTCDFFMSNIKINLFFEPKHSEIEVIKRQLKETYGTQ